MYGTGEVLGAVAPPVTAAVVLPNTGIGTNITMLAVAVVAGLSVWAVVYRRANR